ncbi:hypothetical protein EI94DRAFT_1745468 [Lactarius quietus]|nr:hypothetical protein EI94DRAFT_1745468 [Lactarius quietus]
MNRQKAFNKRRPVPSSTPKVPSAGKRLIAIDAIVDAIFSFSSSRTIISLSQTCRAAHPIAASYFRVAYNPERFLQQFLPDPPDVCAFRTLQAEIGVVVYGKAVRNFLGRAPLTDTEMKLSVDRPYAPRVNEFLKDVGYDVETREKESVFTKKGKDEHKIVLRIGPPQSFKTTDKARDFPREFTDVLTFDGAYSLFPSQYDEPYVDPLALPKLPQSTPNPKYRSFSDRSSWVVSFDKSNIVLPLLAFGISAPVRDPLYTSSCVMVWPSQNEKPKSTGGAVIQLRGIVLRSRLLRLNHVICCPQLSQFVQQFLARLVLANPARANSCFDTEVAQFLRIVFEKADIRYGIVSYSTVWAIMKEMTPLPSDTPSAGGLQWPRPVLTRECPYIPPV